MRNQVRLLLILITLILTIGVFQNCSSSDLVFEDLATKSLLEEFDYSYKSAPPHYLQSVFILEADPNPNMRFKIIVLAGTPSRSSNSGLLSVRATDKDGRLICPEEALDLSSGQKIWEISCVPPFVFSEAKITMTLTGSDADYTTSKIYSLD